MTNDKVKLLSVGALVVLAGAIYADLGLSNTSTSSKRLSTNATLKGKSSTTRVKILKSSSKSMVPTVSQVAPGCLPSQLQLSDGKPNVNEGLGYNIFIGMGHFLSGFTIQNISSQPYSVGGGLPTYVRSVVAGSASDAVSNPGLVQIDRSLVSDITPGISPGPIFTLYPGKVAGFWMWLSVDRTLNPNYKPLPGAQAQVQQEELSSEADGYEVLTLPTPQGPITVACYLGKVFTIPNQNQYLSRITDIYPIQQNFTPSGPPASYDFEN